jgi:hypothetical protein
VLEYAKGSSEMMNTLVAHANLRRFSRYLVPLVQSLVVVALVVKYALYRRVII